MRRVLALCCLVLASCHPPAPAAAVVHHEAGPFTMQSRVLGEARRINIFVPPGYMDSGARYPVLYMPDGGLEEDFPHVTEDIAAAVRAGEMRPMIVVGIENTERRRDMTGPTMNEDDKKIAPRVGGSAEFRAFIRDELMPEIDRRVRGDGQTAIVGESLAGLFVLETFFAQPELFDTYIALSPSLWWNDRALLRGAAKQLSERPRWPATLYFATAGDDDPDGDGEALAAALRAAAPAGLSWSYETHPDLLHSTIYRGASPAVFRRLFPPAGR